MQALHRSRALICFLKNKPALRRFRVTNSLNIHSRSPLLQQTALWTTVPVRYATSLPDQPQFDLSNPLLVKIASNPELVSTLQEFAELLQTKGIDVTSGEPPPITEAMKLFSDPQVREVSGRIARGLQAVGVPLDPQALMAMMPKHTTNVHATEKLESTSFQQLEEKVSEIDHDILGSEQKILEKEQDILKKEQKILEKEQKALEEEQNVLEKEQDILGKEQKVSGVEQKVSGVEQKVSEVEQMGTIGKFTTKIKSFFNSLF
ncbi:2737_t:CDS:1 [Paraglomus brasilianum]|uniref:2737_t:CDS:1 n=1 Tax=Paraglomus brasilianum TaxID=144538 RepID=A0A9N8Z9T3_9GLOM|nr:2737_t:CDS:1 [Paraglomus brasilianum]